VDPVLCDSWGAAHAFAGRSAVRGRRARPIDHAARRGGGTARYDAGSVAFLARGRDCPLRSRTRGARWW
jgi:hypothetical protein